MGWRRRRAARAVIEEAETRRSDCEDHGDYVSASVYEQFLHEFDEDDVYMALYRAGVSTVDGALSWLDLQVGA